MVTPASALQRFRFIKSKVHQIVYISNKQTLSHDIGDSDIGDTTLWETPL